MCRIACRIAIFAMLLFTLALPGALATAAPTGAELNSAEAIQRWIATYRSKPDPAAIPAVVRALVKFGAFKDVETSGTQLGFVAGVLGANPARAENLIAKMLPLPDEAQWLVVRAIAYSGLPEWRSLLVKFADRLSARKVMIERTLSGKLPTLWLMIPSEKPSTWGKMKGYFASDDSKHVKDATLEPTPELIDTLWGYYYATGSARPISRIVMLLPWANEEDSVEKLTIGSMAKYTLAANAARESELLTILKRTREHQDKDKDKATAKILDEVIEAAETVEAAALRKKALAAIEELKRKGPGTKRNVSFWGQVGQGALAVGCIAAAAAGQIEFGIPCVIAGGVSSAALTFWEKSP